MRRSVLRNAVSALLFAVAVAGFVTQYRRLKEGLIPPGDARTYLIAYALVAVYALVSIYLRSRGPRTP